MNCNLDQPIVELVGGMGIDLWERGTWLDVLSKNKVVVCTAEILNQCLWKSFISIDGINLLIFDEAHHAKKGHPYARIIKDHYLKAKKEGKVVPRIFGMTASPVDSQEDPKVASRRLESLLDSKLATASDLALLRMFSNRPTEKIGEYEQPDIPGDTGLHKHMRTTFSAIPKFEKLSHRASEARIELGDWCSDLIWRYSLQKEEAARKMERKTEQEANKVSRFHSLHCHFHVSSNPFGWPKSRFIAPDLA